MSGTRVRRGAAPVPPVLLPALLTALLVVGGGVGGVVAQEPPGTILELVPSGTLSPAEVDARTAGRFRNDGETPPRAAHTVDSYLLRYRSSWPDTGAEPGLEPAEVLAQLFVPRGVERTPLFAFAPGSTGLVEACAPSRAFVDGGSYQTYNAYTLAYAGQGFVSIMPNYLGFFDVGTLQPYYVREAEANAVLDALRAAESALTRLGTGIETTGAFVGGYSQGGHAAFAAADLAASYAPEVPLAGVIGFGATTGMAALFREFSYVAPWVLYSWSVFYPDRFDPAEVLLPGYAARLETDAERFCVLGIQGYYPSTPEGLFRPEFVAALRGGTLERDYPELAELFAENDAGLAGHGLPAMVLQGVNDTVVGLETQNAFVGELCALGSPVRYPVYLRTRHETRYIGFRDAIDWMRALAAGDAPPSDCEPLSEP